MSLTFQSRDETSNEKKPIKIFTVFPNLLVRFSYECKGYKVNAYWKLQKQTPGDNL